MKEWKVPALGNSFTCIPAVGGKWYPECLNSGFSAQNWGEDSGWLHADSLKGLDCTGSYRACMGWREGAHQRSPIIILQRVGCICHRSPFGQQPHNEVQLQWAAEMESPRLARVGLMAQPTARRFSQQGKVWSSSNGIRGCTQWVAGSQLVTAPEKEKALAIFTEVLIQSLPTSHYSLELDLGLLLQQPGSRPASTGL